MPGTITTDHFYARLGSAPGAAPAGQVVFYFKVDGLPYYKDEFGVESSWAGGGASGDVILTDNMANAYRIRESSNPYMVFTTTDGAESIQMGNKGTVAALTTSIEGGTGGISLDSDGTLLLDSAAALELNSSAAAINIGNDAVNQDINIGTGGDRGITVGTTGGTTQTDVFSGTGGMNLTTTGAMDITVPDNNAAAYSLNDGTDPYLAVVTTNASEAMSFGNTTTNPDYNFLGSGQGTFSGPVDFDAAVTLTGSSSYSQTAGGFTYNVSGGDFTVTGNNFDITAGAGGANAIQLVASGTGGFDFDVGTGGWTVDVAGGSTEFTVPDNLANAFNLNEGGNDYIDVDTTNGSEAVTFGNAATNPTYEFLGSGSASFGAPVLLTESAAAPGTPGAGLFAIYPKVDGLLYGLNSSGAEFSLSFDERFSNQSQDSATITNTAAETAFNLNSGAFDPGDLTDGVRLRIYASGFVIGSTGGPTLTIKLRISSPAGPTVIDLIEHTASPVDGDMWEIDSHVSIRAGGGPAQRDVLATGGVAIGTPGTVTAIRDRVRANAALDESSEWTVEVTATWSAAALGNQVISEELIVERF